MNQVNTLSGTYHVRSPILNPKTIIVAFFTGWLILFLSLSGNAFAKETQTREKRPTLSQKQSSTNKPHKKLTEKKSNKKLTEKKPLKKTADKKSSKKLADKKPLKKTAENKSNKKLTENKSNKKLAYKRSNKKRTSQKKHNERPQILGKTLQAEMKKYLGVPYRYGGNTTRGMDCSGFVKRIYSETFSTDLPHQASQQFSSTKLKKISSKDLQTGDLVFFSARKKRINHVGIYLSNNKFIHAIRKKGITVSNLDSNWWQSQIVGAKRLKRIELKDASTHVSPREINLMFVESQQIWSRFAEPSSEYVN